MGFYMTPEEAIKAKLLIGSKNRRTDIKANFEICKLEGKDGFVRGKLNVGDTDDILQVLVKLYPEYKDQLETIIADCNERYTFREGIIDFDEFKKELNKFYIHNDDIAKLLLDEEINSDINPYTQLFDLYKQNGSQDIQKRIDKLQDVDVYKLFIAEEGYRFKPVPVEFKPVDIDIDNLPTLSEMFNNKES